MGAEQNIGQLGHAVFAGSGEAAGGLLKAWPIQALVSHQVGTTGHRHHSGWCRGLEGIEQQLGLFINTLPIIAAPSSAQPVSQWLNELQALNLSLREFEHVPLYDIQGWAGKQGSALFGSLLVFENFPVAEALKQGAPAGLTFGALRNHEITSYPLTLGIEVGASLRLTEGAETLFAELKRLGYKTAILSGGFSYFAHQLQAKLGIDYVFANELQIVDGALTGVAVEPIVDAQRKADLLRELAHKEGLRLEQTIAVGDGANDLPMLGLAGLGVAFRAKPLVKQSAKQAISTLGLDGILYLLGFRDRDGHD